MPWVLSIRNAQCAHSLISPVSNLVTYTGILYWFNGRTGWIRVIKWPKFLPVTLQVLTSRLCFQLGELFKTFWSLLSTLSDQNHLQHLFLQQADRYTSLVFPIFSGHVYSFFLTFMKVRIQCAPLYLKPQRVFYEITASPGSPFCIPSLKQGYSNVTVCLISWEDLMCLVSLFLCWFWD